jgi:predicted nucleic acid-binding protein
VDTSGIFALLDADDKHHRAARAAWGRLVSEREPLITTNYVIIEVTALLQSRFGIKSVRAFHESILPLLRIEWIDQESHNMSLKALLYHSKSRLSLVDCTSFEQMRKLGIRTAFTYDRHFREQGFEIA